MTHIPDISAQKLESARKAAGLIQLGESAECSQSKSQKLVFYMLTDKKHRNTSE